MNRLHFLVVTLTLAGLFAVSVGCEKKETTPTRTPANAPAMNMPMNNAMMNNGSAYSPAGQDIIATLETQGNFGTLLTLIDAAGLTNTLKGGQYTIFAPTDDAFKAANINVFEWTKPENKEKLANLLKAHVIKESMTMDQLKTSDKVTSLTGRFITVTRDGDTVKVAAVKITGTPIKGSNGMVYKVEKVLAADTESPTTMPSN